MVAPSLLDITSIMSVTPSMTTSAGVRCIARTTLDPHCRLAVDMRSTLDHTSTVDAPVQRPAPVTPVVSDDDTIATSPPTNTGVPAISRLTVDRAHLMRTISS